MINTPHTHVEIVRSLGVQGWQHLDPIVLAALTIQSPLLLVGPHGTAKSLLVERLSAALGMTWRHYNASLINYDDLVGIPLPDEQGETLHFVTTPGAIWDAEFVFFDEISRCRADLQNKLFPIIHERRVNGIRLEKLRHRWAAMNPPAPEDPEDRPGQHYLGSEPLDPALADRFPFIVRVPTWSEMSEDDRRHIIDWRDEDLTSETDFSQTLVDCVNQCAAYIPLLEDELADWLADYVLYIVDLLEKARLPQSPRRARMLARNIVSIHAARMVLEGEEAELDYSTEMALIYGLPENASEVPPTPANIVAAHRQAWEISMLDKDDEMRQVFVEPDPVRRVLLADQLDLDDQKISRLITQMLGDQTSEARRVGLAVAVFLAFCERRNLTSAAWEPLAQLASRVLDPRGLAIEINPGPPQIAWQTISNWLNAPRDLTSRRACLERNYVLSGFPQLWTTENWDHALRRFQADLDLFGIQETTS